MQGSLSMLHSLPGSLCNASTGHDDQIVIVWAYQDWLRPFSDKPLPAEGEADDCIRCLPCSQYSQKHRPCIDRRWQRRLHAETRHTCKVLCCMMAAKGARSLHAFSHSYMSRCKVPSGIERLPWVCSTDSHSACSWSCQACTCMSTVSSGRALAMQAKHVQSLYPGH